MSELERLVYSAAEAEFRLSESDGTQKLDSYFCIYNSLSVDLGGFREFVNVGAATRNFNSTEVDCRSLFNHDKNLILGRTVAGDHRLYDSPLGARAETRLDPEVSYVKDLIRNIRSGKITQMSFGFRTIKDAWSIREGKNIRALMDISLHDGDTSPVTYPAYPSTSVKVRSEIRDVVPDPNELAAVLIRFDQKLDLQENDAKMIREYRSAVPGRFDPFVEEVLKLQKRGRDLDLMRRNIEIVQAEMN